MFDNFVFYADNMNSIENLPTEQDKIEVMAAIIRYGVYGQEDYSNIYSKLILPLVKVGIDNAKIRYNSATENGKKGGRTKQFKDEEINALKSQGMTNKQVAAALGCSEKTVQRSNVANRQNGQNIQTDITDKTDKLKEIDKTDTDRQSLNININNNKNSNIFKEKIEEYGRELKTIEEQETANKVIKDLQKQGFNDEFIYYALIDVKECKKDIIQWQGLFFNKGFQDKINYKINIEHRKEEEKKKKATEIAAAIDKQLEKGVKIINVKAGEKPIDKGYINLDDITDD